MHLSRFRCPPYIKRAKIYQPCSNIILVVKHHKLVAKKFNAYWKPAKLTDNCWNIFKLPCTTWFCSTTVTRGLPLRNASSRLGEFCALDGDVVQESFFPRGPDGSTATCVMWVNNCACSVLWKLLSCPEPARLTPIKTTPEVKDSLTFWLVKSEMKPSPPPPLNGAFISNLKVYSITIL